MSFISFMGGYFFVLGGRLKTLSPCLATSLMVLRKELLPALYFVDIALGYTVCVHGLLN